MNVAGLLFLLTAHFLTGKGLLHLLGIQLRPAGHRALALISGTGIASLLPFFLELLRIPLTSFSCALALSLAALLCNLSWLLSRRKSDFRLGFRKLRFRPDPGEWPFLLAIGLLLFLSVWECYYWPVTPRDMLSGPEAIAEYAVREKTMINSVFSVNLETTNNHLKPPFAASLQLLYKLYVQPFGQLWLSVLVVSFTVFLYDMLRARLHPAFAGLLLLLFTATPELYAYTYMALFDYSNMVFLFLSCYFVECYLRLRTLNLLLFACLMAGMATYIRSETLVLIVLLAPVLVYDGWKHKSGWRRTIVQTLLLPASSFLFYFLCINVYIRHYLPVHFEVGQAINPHLSNLRPLWKRFSAMNTWFIFGSDSLAFWNLTLYFFLLLIAADMLIYRKLQASARFWLYAALVVYAGIPLLGFLLPLFDLMNTTKRALFKLFPLLLGALQYNTLLQSCSARIRRWYQSGTQQTAAGLRRQA